MRLHALYMPRGKGVATRNLTLSRHAVTAAAQVLGIRGVETVRISESAYVRVHRPRVARRPSSAMLWIHGGGYVLGSARLEDRKCRRMADDLGVIVVAVDYRLAPESPYPAALDDCYAAVKWLVAQADIDESRIVVSGVSAGAGLAAALALRCTDSGIKLAGQVLQYPMLDDRTALKSTAPCLGWTPDDNRFGWRSYLATDFGANTLSEYAAPARRVDLSGLPATWIGVGTADLFHDEDIDYAARLQAAGVPVDLTVVPGAFHGFDVVARNSMVRSFKAARSNAMRAMLT